MLRLIDLFCGAGGFTQGFVNQQGYEPVFANDIDAAAIDTYRANFDPAGRHSFCAELTQLLDDPQTKIPQADVVIGGPPCQGFSLLNKQRSGDPRRSLWRPYLEVVRRSGARAFIMENVPQLLRSYELLDLKEMAAELGFVHFQGRVLCAADYGAPQTRRRAIIIASATGPIDFPQTSHADPKTLAKNKALANHSFPCDDSTVPPWRTVRDAIGDLDAIEIEHTNLRPDLGPPLDLHFGRNPTQESIERYRTIPAGGNRFDLQKRRPDLTPDCWLRKKSGGTDLFGRLWWDRPSVTIRTEFFKPEKGRYLHPQQNRPITHREAARLQGFPDSFHFCGSKTQIARQIGNAVPPHLAAALAAQFAQSLAESTH